MATVNVPGQNFSYWVPDEGQAFKNSQGTVFYRKDGALHQVYDNDLKAKGGDAYLQSLGLNNLYTASDSQMSDLMGYTARGPSGLKSGGNDINGLTGLQQKSGEVITFGPGATNPHAASIVSNQQGDISPTAPQYAQDGAAPFTTDPNPNRSNAPMGGFGGYQAPSGPAPSFNGGAAPVNTALQLKPGETIAQYNQRIAGMNSAGGTQYFAGSTGPISSSVLSGGSTPSVNYSQAPSLPQYSAAKGLDTNVPQMTMTQSETDIQSRVDKLLGLNDQLSTKDQFTNEQNAAQDIAGKQRLVNDFSSQLKVIQLEAANIQQVTQTGQGVTTAVDQRQRTEALRLNNVKSLGVYAQLEMAKGNLATAQDAVDRAIELKYGPIEAEKKAQLENIEIIKNSPKSTIEDKNRALVIEASVKASAEVIDQQKEDEQRIWEVYVNATQNGLTDVTTLNKIKNAATAQEALAIAAGAGVAANQKKPITSGALSYTQDDISEGYSILKTGKGINGQSYGNPMGADGFVDPRVYLSMLDEWRQGGGQVDDFLKQYPTTLINPTNTWVGAELQSRQVAWKPVASESTEVSFTPTQKLQLEQAGLTNAPRQQQLDHLFKNEAIVNPFKTQ